MEKATFGAGCFWGVEVDFGRIPGVTADRRGLRGRQAERPSYKDVCTDQTGHAEVVELDFDPAKVSYEQLAGGLLRASRSDPAQSPGSRLGNAIPQRDLLSLARAGSRGARQVSSS